MQPDRISVQETLEHALSLMLHSPHVPVVGCGRTDTGVHASCYYAHFESEQRFTQEQCARLVCRLNGFLPKDVAIFDLFPVKGAAHARFDAIDRTYNYYIATRKNPFTYPCRMFSFRQLDVEQMNKAAALLLQHEDFTSFSKVHTQVNNFICHVSEAVWHENDGELVFTITANRFLRNMVRAIVGTLLDVGLGKTSVAEFGDIMSQKDRCKAGTSVPACALFLSNVRYNWDEIRL